VNGLAHILFATVFSVYPPSTRWARSPMRSDRRVAARSWASLRWFGASGRRSWQAGCSARRRWRWTPGRSAAARSARQRPEEMEELDLDEI
jgi:hypothetical protein